MAKNLVCLIASHSYELICHDESDGDTWRCRRCGRLRYNLPRSAFGGAAATGGGIF
jgi:hypothetical protein